MTHHESETDEALYLGDYDLVVLIIRNTIVAS
jgi:hypothetical protein